MDRRGSGIGRILNSYTGFAEQPEFFSNEFYFQVVLPNRSVSTSAQMILDFSEETQLSHEKTQLAKRNFNPEQDWELIYFKEKLISLVGKEFRNKTIQQLIQLFDRYRYEYSFNRRNIADLFKITENGASVFIKKCLSLNIIEKEKKDSYRFLNLTSKLEKRV